MEIARKFLGGDIGVTAVEKLGPRLVEIGRFTEAAEAYVQADLIKQAIDALIQGEEWNKAKKIARDIEPR